MPYYAHIRQDENGETIYQTVAEHLTGTAALCREFAADFGAEADGDLMGLAHDLGKCTDAFQKRLLEGGPVVDHTTAGMLTCIRMKRPSAAACVAGHHGGLLDVGNLRTDRAGEATLSGRFKKGVEGHYLERCGESGVTLPTLPPETPERDPLKASFRTRMLYSCLVDADFLDTERFMDGERGRGGYDDLPTLLRRLKEYIAPWQEPKTVLNKLRCKILNSCLDTGSKPKGIYTLTVPTGGGKTVASLAFALRHAVAHGMRRVIYVVPYTSIIEQNAEVFREILGDGNVLEHHSGVQFELSDGASPEEVRRALAAENWDMPVIVTTAVQFFESIYANRSSKCRKLHNLADSVIIFDEAQMLPLCHLRPCVAAMASLAEQFRSTLVLCTATQPSLGDLLHTYAPSCPVTELCPQTAEEYDSFRRVTFRQEGILEDDVLAEKLSEHRQVLCIVNSRKAAQSIFARLPQEASFHLSTLMVPAQRQTLLDEIRRRLKAGGTVPRRVDLADRGGRGRGLSRGVPRAGWAGFRLAGGGALQPRGETGTGGKHRHRLRAGRTAANVVPHSNRRYARSIDEQLRYRRAGNDAELFRRAAQLKRRNHSTSRVLSRRLKRASTAANCRFAPWRRIFI